MAVRGLPIISSALYPNICSALAFQNVIRASLSAQIIASIAVSATDLKRSSLSCSFSRVRLSRSATEATSPNAEAMSASRPVKPPGLFAKPIMPAGSPSTRRGAIRTLSTLKGSPGIRLAQSLFGKSLW